jgi:hypothetical protein
VTCHILLFDFFFQAETFHYEILVNEETSAIWALWILNNLDIVNFTVNFFASLTLLFSEILGDNLILLVDIDNVDETSIIGREQTLINRVPKQASVHGFIGVDQFNLHGSFRRFKPF